MMTRQILMVLLATCMMVFGTDSQARMAPTGLEYEIAPSHFGDLALAPADTLLHFGATMNCAHLIDGTEEHSLCVLRQLASNQVQLDGKRGATQNFWTYQAILAAVFLGLAYGLGRLVQDRGWKVGYTRKTNALILYFLPYVAMHGPSPYAPMVTASLSLGVFVVLLMVMSAPIRRRIPAIATAFASIDRPEDRPFTLTWLITSVLASWSVLLVWLWLSPETAVYIFVALFISGIGDALAEPVGIRFGRHSYVTRALWTDKTYIRTLEGSATVLLSGVVAVLLVHGLPDTPQAWLALALFPIAGAIAEAKSPHTWDQPFIIGVCAVIAFFISMIGL